MDRVILHADINNCYASIECLHRPQLRGLPVVVGGDEAARHGIVLAKNEPAKRYGIRTGQTLVEARRACPQLVTLQPDYPLYLRYSRLIREIYLDYTDQVEPFSIDECWLDVTGSAGLFGEGERIAGEVRRRVKRETGVTVSIGVSWNKVFAKLGSDMRKPDAVTVISRENYRERVWPLPAPELLYVGTATARKLRDHGILTIGELANCPCAELERFLGKWGSVLWVFANGLDRAPVSRAGDEALFKSVGNSMTTPRDLTNFDEVRNALWVLGESVAERLRAQGLCGRTVTLGVRDSELRGFTRQRRGERPLTLAGEIVSRAQLLFQGGWDFERPVRSLGVSVGDILPADAKRQTSLYIDEERRQRLERLEAAAQQLRGRFGHGCLQRAALLQDPVGKISPRDDHLIHPIGYF